MLEGIAAARSQMGLRDGRRPAASAGRHRRRCSPRPATARRTSSIAVALPADRLERRVSLGVHARRCPRVCTRRCSHSRSLGALARRERSDERLLPRRQDDPRPRTAATPRLQDPARDHGQPPGAARDRATVRLRSEACGREQGKRDARRRVRPPADRVANAPDAGVATGLTTSTASSASSRIARCPSSSGSSPGRSRWLPPSRCMSRVRAISRSANP